MAKKKKITVIANKNVNLGSLTNINRYMNKKVLTKSGKRIGKVDEFFLENDVFVGISVKGLFSKQYIGKEYFSNFSEEALILSIDPVILMKGKQVFDVEGKKIGKVVEVLRKDSKNDFTEILVKRNLFSKKISIPKENISTTKKNVILNKKIDK